MIIFLITGINLENDESNINYRRRAATGVDMADIVKSNTIQAKTNRNFDVDIKK